MTGREIARLAFELKSAPRVPVTIVGGGAWAVHHAGKTFAQIKNDPAQIADAFIRYCRLCGHDLLWMGSNFINYPIHFLGCALKDDSSDYPALEGSVIKSLDEMETLSIEKVMKHPTMQAILEAHNLVSNAVGKETLVIPTNWAPFTFAARILGVENTMMATISDPDRLTRLIEFATDLIWSIVESVIAHPDVLEIEPHCFSLENKVPLKTAKDVLGGKVCIAGNISPTGAFLTGRPEEVIDEAKSCLAVWGEDPGYILTVGCDFSKDVPLENMMALMSFKKF